MGYPRITQYPKNPITIADGETYIIRAGGDFIRVRRANATFRMTLDGQTELNVEQNDVARMTAGDTFKVIVIENTSGGDLEFQLEIGQGAIETNNVSISGILQVENAGGDELKVKTEGATRLNVFDTDVWSNLLALYRLHAGLLGRIAGD